MDRQAAEQNLFLLTLGPYECLSQGFVSLIDFEKYQRSVLEFRADEEILKPNDLSRGSYVQVQFLTEEIKKNRLILKVGLIKAVHMGLIPLVGYSEYKARLQENWPRLLLIQMGVFVPLDIFIGPQASLPEPVLPNPSVSDCEVPIHILPMKRECPSIGSMASRPIRRMTPEDDDDEDS